uniref:Uncharacterized protein n=1 Tax=Panagrolaimus davidi TaxID=227884 RepID=A0A914PJX2_9BILA
MSTKNHKYSFVEQSFITSENQYYNLNLNQSKKCPILVPVQSNSKPNNDKYCVSDDYEEKEKSQSWKKSSKISTFTTLNEENDDFKSRWENENTLKTINKSTLSLHIASVEDSDEAAASDLFDDENIEGLKKQTVEPLWEFSRSNDGQSSEGGGARYVPGQYVHVYNPQPAAAQPPIQVEEGENDEAPCNPLRNWDCRGCNLL